MTFYYYTITNTINSKKYVGITTNPTKRQREHFNKLKNNTHINKKLQEAWNRYGANSFIFQVIEKLDVKTVQEAYDYEWELIQKYGDYNILQGSLINPMYTPEIKAKMIKTKQSQVDDIYQIAVVDENENHYKIVRKWHSMKEANRIGGYDFRNICKSVHEYVKGSGYYWVKTTELNQWFPVTTHNNFVAEIDQNNKIIQVERSPVVFERKEGWAVSSIKNAIKRNGENSWSYI